MKNIQIRNAAAGDIETMFRWGEENWQLWGDAETKWYTRDALREWITHPREDILLVAESDGKPVGMCLSYFLGSWSYCAGLFVDTPFRRLGIAKRLVDESIIRLSRKGVEELVFLVEMKNKDGISYYRKTGCKQGGSFVWMYRTFGRKEPA